MYLEEGTTFYTEAVDTINNITYTFTETGIYKGSKGPVMTNVLPSGNYQFEFNYSTHITLAHQYGGTVTSR